MFPRSSGLLLHLTSLPGPHGIGDLGSEAYRFADFLAESGVGWWQTLPVVPPGEGDSPYNATSAFAGNPLLVSLERLAGDGLLERREIRGAHGLRADRVAFPAVARFKLPLL
ncbi:MAG: 4-alpha-glucanotransferase, partial [Planctomycetota bacterium]